MTELFRCSAGHHFDVPMRESLKFLENVSERASVSDFLSFPNPIIQVFKRGPLLPQYQTRFGPAGYSRNPLYTASDIDTTFYEYGFHLLNSKAVDGIEIKITCFSLNCSLDGFISCPYNDQNATNILSSSTNYSAAHSWLKTISPPPDIVEYPSVRHPSPEFPVTGVNYAIYNRVNFKSILQQNPMLITLNNEMRSITVYDLTATWMTTLKPKF